MIRKWLTAYLSYVAGVAAYLFFWGLIATYNEDWVTRDVLSYNLSRLLVGHIPVVFVWLVFLIPLRGMKDDDKR